jgi:hypothetical protein
MTIATPGDVQMSQYVLRLLLLSAAVVALRSTPALAQSSPAIRLTVDATQAPRKILRVQEMIPATPGPMTLFYPKWIQGVHAPIGPVNNMAGLKISANTATLPWTRDALDIFTFHVDVPSAASTN